MGHLMKDSNSRTSYLSLHSPLAFPQEDLDLDNRSALASINSLCAYFLISVLIKTILKDGCFKLLFVCMVQVKPACSGVSTSSQWVGVDDHIGSC